MAVGEPAWLSDWRRDGLLLDRALAQFDAVESVSADALRGLWHGECLPTGHPLDGLLEKLGWWGKRFAGPDEVDPLVFRAAGGMVALDPALLPAGLALRLPRVAGSGPIRFAFRAAWPVLRARRPGARLRDLPFRGRTSAAMIYERQPIIDHLRAVAPGLAIGCMTRRGMDRPYFFLLRREDRSSL